MVIWAVFVTSTYDEIAGWLVAVGLHTFGHRLILEGELTLKQDFMKGDSEILGYYCRFNYPSD